MVILREGLNAWPIPPIIGIRKMELISSPGVARRATTRSASSDESSSKFMMHRLHRVAWVLTMQPNSTSCIEPQIKRGIHRIFFD